MATSKRINAWHIDEVNQGNTDEGLDDKKWYLVHIVDEHYDPIAKKTRKEMRWEVAQYDADYDRCRTYKGTDLSGINIVLSLPELVKLSDSKKALEPIHSALSNKADFEHDFWNPDAHIEITVTIAEARAIRAALKAPHTL